VVRAVLTRARLRRRTSLSSSEMVIGRGLRPLPFTTKEKMIFGLIVRNAMNKSALPFDAPHLDQSKYEANMIIQDLWYKGMADFRQSNSSFQTQSGADEYVLNKYFDEFVQNTFQGPESAPRRLDYVNTEEFFRRIRIQQSNSGIPLIYTFGQIVGYDAPLQSASRVRVFSGLASKTTGSVNFINGSDFVTSNASLFTLNDVGRRIQKDGDAKSYKILAYVSPTRIQLQEKYRGDSADASAYKLGDVGVHANIQGFVGGQIDSEDVILDGSNVVQTIKQFNQIVSLSKSDKTGGNITYQDETSNTLGVMGPSETEIERQTVLLWPKPDQAETITFRFYMKHPELYLDTDRLLLPQKWHRLVERKLDKKLREVFDKEVPQGLIDDIATLERQFDNEPEDLSKTRLIPDTDYLQSRNGQFWYNKDETL